MSTSGYLDSPAKYREMAEERMEVVHVDEFADGMMRELDSDGTCIFQVPFGAFVLVFSSLVGTRQK